MPYKMNIEELLVEHGYLTRSQLERAMYFKEQEPGKTAEQILVDLGYVTEEAVMECAAVRDHLQVTDLDSYKIDLKAADMVSPGFAGHNRIIPIDFEESRLVVAASYPIDMDVIDETATLTGMEVKVVLGSSAAVGRAIDRTYENTSGSNHGFMNRAFGTSGAGITDNRNRQMELVLKERVEGAPVVRMVNAIIEDAYSRNASDIHVEPGNHELVIRMRINGDLIVHTTLEMEYHRPMITRLKLMAGMDIAEKRLPQDGKYHYERADVSTDLRSILRQDPDVIMVGEMRDEETVSIGVRAAITGHLVFSTLHTNDCASTINRLRNMGVAPYMVAAALSGIVAQRLVKVLCPMCCREYEPDERERGLLEGLGAGKVDKLWKASGCPCCNGTGYSRRKAVYELMEVDEEVKFMITDNVLPKEIRTYQKKRGFRSLKENVVQMAIHGETSMEEAEKILYSAE